MAKLLKLKKSNNNKGDKMENLPKSYQKAFDAYLLNENANLNVTEKKELINYLSTQISSGKLELGDIDLIIDNEIADEIIDLQFN